MNTQESNRLIAVEWELADEIAQIVFADKLAALKRKYTLNPSYINRPDLLHTSVTKLENQHWRMKYISKCLPAAKMILKRIKENPELFNSQQSNTK